MIDPSSRDGAIGCFLCLAVGIILALIILLTGAF